jgi:tetratricopeptide (TPR) repeat protein
MRKAGWVFLGFALMWIGLNAHSGWVHYHERAGTLAFESLQIPDELALAQKNPAPWLSPLERQNIDEGKQHLAAARRLGLFTNSAALPKLAWLEFLSGNTEQAVQLLGRASEHQNGQAKALSCYYQGAILNRLGRYGQALTSLDQALAERPDLIISWEERGVSLWQLGRKQEAVSAWSEAVKQNQNLVLANSFLATPADPYFHWMVGLRLQNIGMNELAEKHFGRAIQLDPKFAPRRN